VSTIDEVRTPHLPPGPRLPGPVVAAAWVLSRRRLLDALRRRYGSAFTINLMPFGPCVVLTDASLTKQLLTTNPLIAGTNDPNLGNVLGPGSTFALEGAEHRARRKRMVPPFHGRRLRAYEDLMVEETLREAETWPQGVEFATLEPFMHLTLKIILRTVLGTRAERVPRLAELLPAIIELGARLTVSPVAEKPGRAWGAWARYRRMRAEYDQLAFELIDEAAADPSIEERDDVLAMLVQSVDEDGRPMGRQEIADELLTLFGAGHETTANTLAWAVERLRRNPSVLDRIVAEVDAGGPTPYLEATILEVQRVRPVIAELGRRVVAETMTLGNWTLPRGHQVIAAVDLVHEDESAFPAAHRFDPERFLDAPVDTYSWIPFGGGTRRCIGAAFANQEMIIVLRTLLREYELATTYAPDEKWHSRGVSWSPGRGGLAIVHRRSRPAVLGQAQAQELAP
jgi:cytochrome P450